MNTLTVSPVDTAPARAALQVAAQYYSPALLNHAVRSYYWAAALARADAIAIDDELLFVAAMLHDFGLLPEFDSHALDFEDAGGHIAVVFAAGAGWPPARGRRVQEIIVRHMGDQVDVDTDPEGHLLHRATGIDITGREADLLPTDVRARVLSQWPRLGLAEEFTHCFEQQAVRKPRSAAAVALSHGLATKLRENPLGT